MNRREFGNDRRGISELYGTVLIISLALISAILIVGMGALAIQDLTSDTDEDLARQSVLEMDDRIDELTGSSVDSNTSIEFPEGTAEDIEAKRDQGNVTIIIETHSDFWNATDGTGDPGDLVDATRNKTTREISMGTIVHENDNGRKTAYQGGGVWEKQDGNVRMESAPEVNLADETLELSFVNISNVDLVQEGGTLTIHKNASASQQASANFSRIVREHITRNGTVTAKANISINIESEYCQGWRNYAENSMNIDDSAMTDCGDEAASYTPNTTIELGTFGDGMGNAPDPDFNRSVIYSGKAAFAPDLYNATAGEIENESSHKMFNVSAPDDEDEYRVGVYTKRTPEQPREWWVWNHSDDVWENVENATAPRVGSSGLLDVDGVETSPPTPSPDPPHFQVKNSTWTCVVNTDTGPSDEFAHYVDNRTSNVDGCMNDPVDIEDPEDHYGDFQAVYEIADYDVTVYNASGLDTGNTANDTVWANQNTLNISVEVKNNGTGDPEQPRPIALAFNETTEGEDPFLVNGTKESIAEGSTAQIWFNETTFNVQTIKTYNISVGTRYDGQTERDWTIRPQPPDDSDFNVSIYKVEDNVTAGQGNVTVHYNITNRGEDDATQDVWLSVADGPTIAVNESVPIEGNETAPYFMANGSFEWATAKSDYTIDNVTISTYDDVNETGVTIEAPDANQSEFVITGVNTTSPVVEGDTLFVNATIENQGNASGYQNVVLRKVDGSIAAVKNVSLNEDEKRTIVLPWNTTVGESTKGLEDVTVETADQEWKAPVNVERVDAETDFGVTVNWVTTPVKEGEKLLANVTVENYGENGTQTVVLRDFADHIVDDRELELVNGESRTFNLTWSTTAGDAGTGNLSVTTTDGNSTETDATVLAPSDDASTFVVTGTNTTSPVDAGDTLNVTVTVTNEGETEGTQLVTLKDTEGNLVDFVEVTLGEGETAVLNGTDYRNLTWATDGGDVGAGNVTVRTEDDTRNESVTVEGDKSAPASFDVDIAEWPGSVTEGEPVEVTANVTNSGNETATREVWLEDIEGNPVNSTSLTLGPGASQNVTLTWQTEVGDAGDGEVTVSTDGGSDSEPVVVVASGGSTTFAVDIQEPVGTVTEGETLNVTVTVENTGDRTATKDVRLENFDGELVDTGTVTDLSPSDDPVTINLTWSTQLGDAGTDDLTVATQNDNDTAEATVEEQGVDSPFEVTINAAPDAVVEGNDVEVNVTVLNNGTETATKDVWLEEFDNKITDVQTVTNLAPGEERSFNLTWSTSVGDSETGEEITVASPNDEATGQVDIEPLSGDDSDFEVVINYTNSSIVEGDDLDVNVTVTNDDSGADIQNIVLENFNDDPVNVTEISLAGGESTTFNLTWNTIYGDNGTGDMTVISEDDDSTEEVEVLENETEVRKPADVMFVLDETGSMSAQRQAFDYVDSPSGSYTVPEGELWMPQQEDYCTQNGCSYDDVSNHYYVPGQVIGADSDVDRIEKAKVGEVFAYDYFVSSGDEVEVPAGEMWVPQDSCFGLNCWYDLEPAYLPGETFVVPSDTDRIKKMDLNDDGNDPYGERINATMTALDALNESTDEAGVVEYDTYANTYQPLTGDLQEVHDSLRINPGGYTNIGAGLEEGGENLDTSSDDNKFIILLTDGQHNYGLHPSTKYDEVPDDVCVYTVGFGNHNDTLLKDIADNAGCGNGEYYPASDAGQLTEIFGKIVEDINAPPTPTYNVTITDYNESTVPAGEEAVVRAEIANDGEAAGSQPVTLNDFENNPVDSVMVNVDPGATETYTFRWDTTGEEPSTGDVTVVSPSDDDTAPITIGEPQEPNFQITDVTTTGPVYEGEPLSVSVTVENQGDVADTQTVYLQNPDGEPVDSVEMELAPGEDNTSELVWETEPGDAGDQSINVTTQDDTQPKAVTILEAGGQSTFNVSIDSTNAPVGTSSVFEGDDLLVNATVTNNGNGTDTQYVVLRDFEGNQVAFEQVTLGEGESTGVNLTWSTSVGDAAKSDVTVATEDDQDTQLAELKELSESDGTFEVVQINGTNSPVVEQETMTVNVTITNTGETTDTQYVVLKDLDGDQVDFREETLTPNESATVTLEWQTTRGDAGIGTVNVTTEDDYETADAEVKSLDSVDATFEVTVTGTNAPIVEGEDLSVDVMVENTGETNDTQYVLLNDFEGTQVGYQEVTLDPGESTNVTLTWATERGDAGNGTVNVTSEDTYDTESVVVEAEQTETANFTVDDLDTNADAGNNSEWIVEGETLTANVTVENVGEVEGTQNVWLEDGQGTPLAAEKNVNVPAGGTANVTITWETERGDADVAEVAVTTDDDNFTRGVDIESAEGSGDTTFDVVEVYSEANDAEDKSITETETMNVTANVKNTGGETASQIVELRANGTLVGWNETERLEPGEDMNVTFTWDTERGDADVDEINLTTQDNYELHAVNITELKGSSATFEVVDATVEYPGPPDYEYEYDVTQHDVVVDVEVRNTGADPGTPFVEMSHDVANGRVATAFGVAEIDPGDTDNVTVTWENANNLTSVDELNLTAGENYETVGVNLTAPSSGSWQVDDVDTNADPGDDEQIVAGEMLAVDVTVEAAVPAAAFEDFPNATYLTVSTAYSQNISAVEVTSAGGTTAVTLQLPTYPGMGDDDSPQAIEVQVYQTTATHQVWIKEAEDVDPGSESIGEGSDVGIDIDEIEITG